MQKRSQRLVSCNFLGVCFAAPFLLCLVLQTGCSTETSTTQNSVPNSFAANLPTADDAASHGTARALADDPSRHAVMKVPVESQAPEAMKTIEYEEIDPDRPPRAWALLIGVNDYESEDLESLSFCGHDAFELKDALCNYGGYESAHVALLTDYKRGTRSKGSDVKIDGKPSRENILNKIDEFVRQVGPKDSLLFGFSGHGIAVDGQGYLLPPESDPKDPASTAVPTSIVYSKLRGCRGETIMVVDACQSGGHKSARGFRVDTAAISSGIENSDENDNGIFGLFSCQSKQKSYEDAKLQHGVFTYYLIDAMKGRADANRDKAVTMDEVYNYLLEQVPEHVTKNRLGGEQKPWRVYSASGNPVVARYKYYPHDDDDLPTLAMQGFYGSDWFVEMPWLLPSIRTAVVGKLPQELVPPKEKKGLLDPERGLHGRNVERIKKQFAEVVTQAINSDQEELSLETRDFLSLLLEWNKLEKNEEQIEKLLGGLENIQDSHAKAVFYSHYKDSIELDEAHDPEVLFHEARTMYEKQRPAPKGLLALCIADYASYHARTRDYLGSAAQYKAARQHISAESAPLFYISCLIGESSARRKLGQWKEVKECLDEAADVARNEFEPGDNPQWHPIAARIQERFAWQYMDQWKVVQAQQAFLKAINVWTEFSNNTGEHNPLAVTARFHNQHGLAMSSRYSGELDKAISTYQDLLEEVAEIRDSESDQSARTDLTTRIINSGERLADCFLLSANPNAKRAAGELRRVLYEVEDKADKAVDMAQHVEESARIHCKLALVDWLAERPNAKQRAKEAVEILSQTSEEVATDGSLLSMYLRAVDALVVKSDLDAARDLIRQQQTPENVKLMNRDRLDLLLFVADQIVQRDQNEDAAEDCELLFDSIPDRFLVQDVLPYLRPFFDRVVTKQLNQTNHDEHISSILGHVSVARYSNRSLARSRRPMVVFHFPTDSDHGFAITYDPDHDDGQVIPLEHSLAQLQELNEAGTPAPWPESIVIPDEQLDRLTVYWSDSVQDLSADSILYEVPKAIDAAQIK